MAYTVCPVCGGGKTTKSLGHISEECRRCDGIGYLAEKVEKKAKKKKVEKQLEIEVLKDEL